MTNADDLKSDINFLFEMGNIRFIERMWRRFLRDDFANLAEHHFRTFWIAMVIATREGDVDTGKVAKIALAHDIAESRTGDVDYLARQYVERKEDLALDDMLAGTSVGQEFRDLLHEYEIRESKEAKIVKDADNLDVDFELAEQAHKGSELRQTWQENRSFVAKSKLFTETAKLLYDQLLESNPHDWHAHSQRNRRNGGDWRK